MTKPGFFSQLLSLGQGFRFFNDPSYRERILARCFYGFFLILFFFSLYATISDTFWLRFLQPITAGLSPVGHVSAKAGTSIRKTRVDSLWLPVFSQNTIFNSDVLLTEKDSNIEIEIKKGLLITIEPKSLVRITLQDGRPLLRLSKGEIKTHLTEDQYILIKKGSRIEEVLIRKGTYLIKNDMSAGIQITSYAQEVKTVSSMSEQARTQAKLKDTSNEIESNESIKKTEIKELSPQPSYDLPTPQGGTVFLVKGPQALLVGAKVTCPDKCHLSLYKDQRELKNFNWSEGQPSVIRLEPEDLLQGQYSWTFTSQMFEYKSTFSVQQYSDELLEKTIGNGQPMEILGE